MGTRSATHWDDVYASRNLTEVSWYQPEPSTSLRLLRASVGPESAVVDIGAGAGTLPDALLHAGFRDVTVLDVSREALDLVRERLGDRVALVGTDLLDWRPTRRYGAWHDRALFHFLTDPADQEAYVELAARALEPYGVLVLGIFAEDGPDSCSGLPTARYDAAALAARFAPRFRLVGSEREEHRTPGGAVQAFTWVVLRRGTRQP